MWNVDPFKPDPGPCPCDDAPHHTCVSADYVPSKTILVTPWRAATSITINAPAVQTSAPFTTKEYRRPGKKTAAPMAAAVDTPRRTR
jgi:hypothetical protein